MVPECEVVCPLCHECCPTVSHFIYVHLMDISDASRKCAGGFPGPCDNKPGTPWTPLWCPKCDEKRKASILASLKQMKADLEARGSA